MQESCVYKAEKFLIYRKK